MSAYRETMGQVLQRMYDNKQLQIQERELSDTELKRREEIAKELPDEEFKDRYGSRWKEVKLATATKQAKSESVEEEKLEKMDEAAGFSAGMISKLKKSYDGLKTINPTSPTAKKLFGVLDKMNKEQLIQIVKADINFLSLLAANRLIKDHNMSGAEINKVKKEEVDLDERSRQLKDPKKEMMISYKGSVMVINKKDWPKYEKKGAVQAEQLAKIKGNTPAADGRRAATQDDIDSAEKKGDKKLVKKLKEEVELDEKAKYDIYHKDFSSAMQHAYKAAKKMYGITVDPKEIDDKVATGPRKPSTGKTNTYRLKGDKGAIQVQVYNTGKKYELNMYKEEVELDEKLISARGKDIAKKMRKNRTMAPHAKVVAKMQTVTADKLDRMLPDYVSGGDIRAMFKEELDEAKQVLAHGGKGKYKVVNDGSGNIDVMFKGKSVGKGDYDRGAGSFFMSIKGEKGQKSFDDAQAIADYFAKNKITEAHEMGTDEYRKYLEDLTPHSTESARSDAMRAMRRDKSMIRGKDSADVDDVATKDDRKAASKNILQQLKKTLDTKGKTDIEFLDKKKKKVPYDIAVKAVKKYMGFRSSTDKLKFQQALAKSYKSMLQAVKEDYVVPKTHSESILDRIDTKLKERKNG